VLGLYARVFGGVPLGADEYVISSDEKISIQARCRCHPSLAPGAARTMRVNHEYDRGGALAYLAPPLPSTSEPLSRSAPTARKSSPPPTPATPNGSASAPNRPNCRPWPGSTHPPTRPNYRTNEALLTLPWVYL